MYYPIQLFSKNAHPNKTWARDQEEEGEERNINPFNPTPSLKGGRLDDYNLQFNVVKTTLFRAPLSLPKAG
jgi:hypothetical protein